MLKKRLIKSFHVEVAVKRYIKNIPEYRTYNKTIDLLRGDPIDPSIFDPVKWNDLTQKYLKNGKFSLIYEDSHVDGENSYTIHYGKFKNLSPYILIYRVDYSDKVELIREHSNQSGEYEIDEISLFDTYDDALIDLYTHSSETGKNIIKREFIHDPKYGPTWKISIAKKNPVENIDDIEIIRYRIVK